MIMESLGTAACRTYLLADEEEGFAALIDPVLDHFGEYLELLKRRKFTLTHAIDTHTHADHISACAALKDALQCAYVMHERAGSGCVNELVRDGDIIRVGRLHIQVLHMPGHTEDSICLKVGHHFFTGDFLFLGEAGAGRDDLPGGDAGRHWDSIQRLHALPETLVVCPAHEYHESKCSSLGHQRHVNPHLGQRSRDEFIRYVEDLRLGPADWMQDVIKANQSCATDPKAVWIPADLPACEVRGNLAMNINTLPVQLIDVRTFLRMYELQQGIRHAAGGKTHREAWLLLDVREPAELKGHDSVIGGALNIPIGHVVERLHDLEPHREKTIITVCRSGSRAATAARILMSAGFPNVKVLDGGMHAWNRAQQALA